MRGSVGSTGVEICIKQVSRSQVLPSGLAQMKTRTLRPVGTWCGGRALMLPLMAALRSADSRGHGCLLPTPDGHMGGDFQRGCTHTDTRMKGIVLTQPGILFYFLIFNIHLRADSL